MEKIIAVAVLMMSYCAITKADDAGTPKTDIVSIKQLAASVDAAVDQYGLEWSSGTEEAQKKANFQKLTGDITDLIAKASITNNQDFMDISISLEQAYLERIQIADDYFRYNGKSGASVGEMVKIATKRLEDSVSLQAIRQAAIDYVLAPLLKDYSRTRPVKKWIKAREQKQKPASGR